jgi:HSP20 family protein
MALTPFDPFDPFDDILTEPYTGMMSLRQAMNRLFEESFIGPKALEPFRRPLPIDLRETKSDHVIEASLPGIKPSEIQVTVKENVLTIRATREQEEKAEKDGSSYRRRERYVGEVSRSIGLPGPVDASKVSAVYEHGVLTVTVLKTPEIKPAEITIQVKAAEAPKELPKA